MNKEEKGIYSIFMLLGFGIMVMLSLILILLTLDSFIPYRFLRGFLLLLILILFSFQTIKFIKQLNKFRGKE